MVFPDNWRIPTAAKPAVSCDSAEYRDRGGEQVGDAALAVVIEIGSDSCQYAGF
jgi:hypothetical protein